LDFDPLRASISPAHRPDLTSLRNAVGVDPGLGTGSQGSPLTRATLGFVTESLRDSFRDFSVLWLFLVSLLSGFSAKAQETVLIRELVSREFSIHVGGLQTPEIKEIVSREFSISVENGVADRQRELISREFSVVMTTAAPPPRIGDLGVVVSAMGDTVTLNWSGYNPWAVGDVLRFDIYLSDAAPFQSVAGMTPKLSVSGEQLSATLTHLTPFTDHYLAVVPVDALGNFDPIVNYSAAYVLSPELVSREFSIHVENGTSVPQGQLVSREYSVVVVSTAPPPAITGLAVSVSAEGDSATLDWSSYNQYAVGDILGFDVYYSSVAPFSNVTGMTPLRRVPGGTSSVVLTGLARFTDHYFAVVPVDGLEQFVPEVRYAAGYVLSPQLVSREFSVFIENGPAELIPQLVSREFSILVPDAAFPAPVTGLGSGFSVSTATTDFGAVVLDWTGYNELAQRDVVRYRIYVGDRFFESVDGLVPVGFANAGTQRFTLTGQPGNRVLHFAVVAEDALGGFNPVVRSVSGQTSVSGVGEVVNLAAVSGPDRLRFAWDAPAETGGFLAGYRVFFGDTSVPVSLPASTRTWEVTGLLPATGYPVRVSTVDTFGKVSSGVTLVGATWLPNPTALSLTAQGEDVILSWTAAEPDALVKEYRVYRDNKPFTDVSSLVAIGTTSGTGVKIGTIASVTGSHFAVATVNLSNGSDPAVVSISATRERQVIDFPYPNLNGPLIPLAATASSGLPVTFLSQPSSVAVVEGHALRVVQGGTVTVTAYQAGNGAYWPAEATQELRIPPVIQRFTANGTDLTDGLRLTAVDVRLAVEAADAIGLFRAEFFGRPAGTDPWTLLGWDENPAEGWSISLGLLGLPRGEYDARAVVLTTDGSSSERIRRVTLDPIPLPDLTLHAFDLPATAFAGQGMSVGWTTTNAGIGGASGGWSTRVFLAQQANGANPLDRGTVSTNRSLAVAESLQQAASVLIPPGWSGQAYVIVDLDSGKTVNESNEGNNRVISAVPIQVLAPDLVLESVNAPVSAILGQSIPITWGVTNRGGAPTTVAWRDRIWLTPTAGTRTGATELTALAGPEDGLAASAGYARSTSVTLPLSTSVPAGDYFLLVEADGDGSQPESDEGNNRLSRAIRLTLPPSPDLTVAEVIAPESASPGQSIEIRWKTSNLGAVPARGPWKESLSVSNSVQGLREWALLNFEGEIPAGGTVDRIHAIAVPANTAAGPNHFWVTTDAKNEVVEAVESNNGRRSEVAPTVPQVLTLTLSASQIREDASVRIVRGSMTRNGPTGTTLRVALTGADPTEITAPAEVTIPAGQTAVVFDLTVVSDGVVDGHQNLTLRVNADGYTPAAAELIVLDADLYRLFVTVDPATVVEGSVVMGTLRREGPTERPLTVTIVSSQENQLSPTPSVTIPAGADSVAFEALAVDDARAESPTDYTLVASAPAHHDGTATVRILDNDVPSLAISLASRTVSEGGGPYATSATLTRSPVGSGDLTVELVNPNPGLLLMPTRVVVAAGRASKSFPVGVVDDGRVNGSRTVAIGGFALAAGSGTRLAEAAPDLLTVTDDDGPTLKLVAAQGLVKEGLSSATTLTVTRNTDPTAPLEVSLVSGDTSEATVPAAVTIPAGAASVTFALVSLADGQPDGNQSVVLTASASGFVDGTTTVVVSDTDLPDLTVSGVTHLTGATSRQRIEVRYRIGNQGLSAATQSVLTRVYLSRDAVVGDDVLAAQSRLTETLAVGAFVERVETVELPVEIGNYWVVVETDAEQALDEVLENNNSALSSQPIVVTADYGAWVKNAEPEARLAGSPVPLYGQTTNSAGLPVGNKPVLIHVFVRGTERKISATSDSSGNFAAVFNPLPGEAGRYEILATHPGIARAPVQDTFALLGFRPEPASLSLTLIEGSSASRTVQLRNLADIALEGVTAEIVSKPANLEVTFGVEGAGDAAQESSRRSFRLASPTPAFSRSGANGGTRTAATEVEPVRSPWRLASVAEEPETNYVGVGQAVGLHRVEPRLQGNGSTLSALGTVNLNVTLRAPVAESYGTVHLKVRTDEGLAQDVYFGVSVEPLRPRLVALPGNLSASMRVGGQSIVEFDVVNAGGKVSGPITLALPNVPWMSLATTNPMPALAPGETNRVTVLLTPSADLALGPYTGNLAANTPGAGVGIPFNFRAVSEAKGDLRIEVVDEFTYYAEGAPKVAGATVTVRDAVDGRVVASGVTDHDGQVKISNLLESMYDIEVAAEKHAPVRVHRSVRAGSVETLQAFLSREVVKYSWRVESIEIEDRYRMIVETEFETFVPAPVITMEPSVIDLYDVVEDRMLVELTVSNHGLVAAEAASLTFPAHPRWEVVPLIRSLGTLPAQSSMRIPVEIRRRSLPPSASARLGMSGQESSTAPCGFSGSLCWSLPCGGLDNHYCLEARVIHAGEECAKPSTHPFVPIGGLMNAPDTGVQQASFVTGLEAGSTTPCDCSVLDGLCTPEVNAGIDLSGMLEKLTELIDALKKKKSKLPIDLDVDEPTLKLELSGQACLCCTNNTLAWGGFAKATLEAEATVVLSAKWPAKWKLGPGWSALNVLLPEDIKLSQTVTLTGSVEMTKECGADPSICGEVRLQWAGSLKGHHIVQASALHLGIPFSGKLDAEWEVSGSLVGHVSYCNGEWSYGLCADYGMNGKLEGVLSAPPPFGEREFSAGGDESEEEGEDSTVCIGDAPKKEEKQWRFGYNPDVVPETVTRALFGEKAAGRVSSDIPDFAGLLYTEEETIGDFLSKRPSSGGVCARVKMRVEQEVAMTRDAFNGSLELENDGSTRLEGVGVEIVFRLETGQPVAAAFELLLESTEVLSAVDGTGILPGNSTGTAKWRIIPTVDAAPEVPTQYFVGGTLSYRLDGQDVTVPLAEVPITVLPSPRLSVKYFHQRDVFSDDPFTPALEPRVPFNLAVMIDNHGKGLAKNFRITSAQPRIVENEKGLLVDFQIVAAQVAGKAVSPSLSMNFGDIGPDSRALGRWLMSSSLQGLFTDYKATFEHIDGLGNPRLSLIDDVAIFEMNHLVQADRTFEDGLPDFLVNRIPDSRDLPDTLYLSDGRTNDVSLVESASFDGAPSAVDLRVEMSATLPSGWTYLRVPEPSDGRLTLVQVLRADGSEVAMSTNVWVTDRTFIGLGRRPVNEHILHLLDYDSSGVYSLIYSVKPAQLTDDVPPTSAVEALAESVMPWFQVRWSGTDQGRLGETASGVAAYDIWVSENGGPFKPWLQGTRLVSATYVGQKDATYAFYSVATDGAGNVEEPPAVPDARTRVGKVNASPILAIPARVTVDEGSTAEFVATANDSDGADQTLIFSLGAIRPAGAVIQPTTGRVTWPTGEADGGTVRPIDVIVTDNGFPSLSATGRVEVVVVEVNTPPVSVGDRITRQPGKRIRVRESQFLANDLDVDGNALSVSAVSPTSVRGGVVRRAEGWITYIPPVGDDATDQFTYTLTDGTYDVTGVVEVVVGAESEDATLNIVGTTVGSDGTLRLALVGIPGREYAVQMATRLVNPVWTTVGVARADAAGRFEFIHANPPAGSAFYRAVERGRPVPE